MKRRFARARILAAILATTLLAACGSSPQQAASSVPESAPASSQAAQPSSAAESSGEPEASAGLPIVTEPTTLSLWIPMSSQVAEIIQDFNENEMYQELERRTGVHIDFVIPPATEQQQTLNVLIASDNYPEMLHLLPFTSPSYPGGVDKGIEDGVILNVNDLVDQYMPNMKALMESGDDVAKAVYTDAGNIAGFYNIAPEAQTPWYGLAVRQDWLDDCGLDIPVTYDDWYVMLKAFKEQKGAIAPAMLYSSGVHQYDCWNAGYGVAGNGTKFSQKNGVVEYGPMQPGYKEYLEMVHKWYSEGLIDQDFPTRVDDSTAPESYTTTGKTGAWHDMYVNLGGLKEKTDDPNFQAVAVPNPVRNAGDTLHLGQYNARVGRNMIVITTKCKNPEVAAKWLDYQYGDEGSILVNYGIEGKTFEYDENGEPKLNDFIMKNPDGLTLVQTMGVYLKPPGGGFRYYWQREMADMPQENLDAPGIWESNEDFTDHIPGHAVLTAEEGNEYALIMGDIDTYVSEMTLKFIMGQESLDNFDSYAAQLRSMNIDRAVELKQASYDRYSAR